MKIKISALLATAITIISPALVAQSSSNANNFENYAIIDAATAPIRSQDDLRNHLAAMPSSPIYKLTPHSRAIFLSSLVFTNRGLASYSYVSLAGISVSDAYQILMLFGAQGTIGDVPNLESISPLDKAIILRAKATNENHNESVIPFIDSL